MSAIHSPKIYPAWLRLLTGFAAIVLIALVFKIMSALSLPSQYLNAYTTVLKGPAQALALQKMHRFDTQSFLYLKGSIQNAANEKNSQCLFNPYEKPLMVPAIFTDASGALEISALSLPLTAQMPQTYLYRQTLHFLGFRGGDTMLYLYAVAGSRDELAALLSQKMGDWKKTLLARGLLLAFLVFSIFWLMNLAVLSTPGLQWVQIFIVNFIFLVIYYSVLLLARYPLVDTLVLTLAILVGSNLIFIPVMLLIRGLTGSVRK